MVVASVLAEVVILFGGRFAIQHVTAGPLADLAVALTGLTWLAYIWRDRFHFLPNKVALYCVISGLVLATPIVSHLYFTPTLEDNIRAWSKRLGYKVSSDPREGVIFGYRLILSNGISVYVYRSKTDEDHLTFRCKLDFDVATHGAYSRAPLERQGLIANRLQNKMASQRIDFNFEPEHAVLLGSTLPISEDLTEALFEGSVREMQFAYISAKTVVRDEVIVENSPRESATSSAATDDNSSKSVQQKQSAANSPNIVTTGPNSPVTIGDNSPITINPEKNPYDTLVIWDFNGAKRTVGQAGTRVEVAAGEETADFEEINRLYDARDWEALLTLCENRITKTPEWLTPYLYSGVANLQLGREEVGVQRLKYVRDKAGSHPDYQEAARILRSLDVP